MINKPTSSNLTRGHGYLENFLAKQRAHEVNRHILSSHRQGRILDIGCGTIPYFLLQTDFREKHGIDPNATNLSEESKIKIQPLWIKRNTVLPYENNSFDVVTMLGVLEHFSPEEVKNIFSESYRILKPAGRLIITTPHPSAAPLLKILGALRFVSEQEIKDLKAQYSVNELSVLLEQAGFAKINLVEGYFQLGLNTRVYIDKEKIFS